MSGDRTFPHDDLQGLARRQDPRGNTDSTAVRHAHGRALRKSCDRCHQHKLRCVRSKTSPTRCIRCQKAGVDCIYSARANKKPTPANIADNNDLETLLGHCDPLPVSIIPDGFETIFETDWHQLDSVCSDPSWLPARDTASIAGSPSAGHNLETSNAHCSSLNSIWPTPSDSSEAVPGLVDGAVDDSMRHSDIFQRLEKAFEKVSEIRASRGSLDCMSSTVIVNGIDIC